MNTNTPTETPTMITVYRDGKLTTEPAPDWWPDWWGDIEGRIEPHSPLRYRAGVVVCPRGGKAFHMRTGAIKTTIYVPLERDLWMFHRDFVLPYLVAENGASKP